MIRYWNRLIKLDEPRLEKFVFDWDYSVNNNNWCSDIENILESVNLLNLFNEKRICNIQIVKNAIYDSYENIWIENWRNKTKLRTYIMFKNVFKTEPYVMMHMSRLQRSLMAQLRCGILPLKIEDSKMLRIQIQDNIVN